MHRHKDRRLDTRRRRSDSVTTGPMRLDPPPPPDEDEALEEFLADHPDASHAIGSRDVNPSPESVGIGYPHDAARAYGAADADGDESRPVGDGAFGPASEPVDVVLQTRGLAKIYGGRSVVNGVDINVRPGEIVGLLGPNGAGKTTTFYMIVGLVRPNGGQIFFKNQEITDLPVHKRARMGLGYLPQEESIFRKLSVEDNLMAILETLPIGKPERKERCNTLLHQFGIDHIRKNLALTLSGGEKRRLTIARSLVTRPSLLMLDEPFSGVDPIAVEDIQQIVASLREAGYAILITDHNVRETLSIVDRAYLIFEGRVESEGTKDFLVHDPVSRRLYLGERFSM